MKNIYKILILFLGGLSVCSCDDYLNEIPDRRIDLDNLSKVSELLTNAYPSGSYLFLEAMTDNVGPVPSNIQITKMEDAYTWSTFSSEDQDTPAYYWSYAYKGIAHANQVLVSLDEIVADKSAKDAVKGEALLIRAYTHFMLVNMFAKHYDAATAGTDLGVPYISKPEKTLYGDYKRETVEKTYELIEKDMLEGLKLVAPKAKNKYHFGREAALALASRFYLFKADYKECLRYSNMLLGEGYNVNYIKSYKKLLMGQGPAGRAQIFNSTTDQSNLLVIRKNLAYQLYPHVGYRMTIAISENLFPNDARAKNQFVANSSNSAGYQAKFENLFKKESLTSSSGLPYTVHTVLRGEEVFFNKLESLIAIARIEADEVEKEKLVVLIKTLFDPFFVERYNVDSQYLDDGLYIDKVFKSMRDQNYVDDSATDLDLIELYVKKQRRSELAEEGLRWFDIKRLKLKITHVNVTGQTFILKKDDSRKIIQLPTYVISNGIKNSTIEESKPISSKLLSDS